MLLGRQVCADIVDSQGSTPLHLAAWAGHQEIAELLVHATAVETVNAKVSPLPPVHALTAIGSVPITSPELIHQWNKTLRDSH